MNKTNKENVELEFLDISETDEANQEKLHDMKLESEQSGVVDIEIDKESEEMKKNKQIDNMESDKDIIELDGEIDNTELDGEIDNTELDEEVDSLYIGTEEDTIIDLVEDSDQAEEGISQKSTSRKPRNRNNKTTSKNRKIITYAKRTMVTLLITISILLGGIYSVMCMLVYGPSETASELFVMSVQETSAIGFLANWFFSEDEIKTIIDKNSIKDTDEITDTNLVNIVTPDNTTADVKTPDIEVVDVKGATYRGKLMKIKDPSRVFVGTVPSFAQGEGLVVSEIAKRYNAIGGINGGEFVDGDNTFTAMPVGLVITKGVITNGDRTTVNHVTGITKDNVLVVGNMNGKQALDLNIRDCVSIANHIGPFLIINGEAQEVGGIGGGINPRTAIGQRADGTILLLVVDGRQANSLGATFADLLYIMQENGAVNASTMDGGTSTQMFYEGQVVNVPYSPTGPRKCPTSFLVGGIN